MIIMLGMIATAIATFWVLRPAGLPVALSVAVAAGWILGPLLGSGMKFGFCLLQRGRRR